MSTQGRADKKETGSGWNTSAASQPGDVAITGCRSITDGMTCVVDHQ